MKVPHQRILSVTVSAMVALASLSASTLAAKSKPSSRSRGTVSMTFRLAIHGDPGPRATFWIAHGPLAGQFGILPMRRSGAGRYRTTAQFPASGRAVFAYQVGQGSVQTRMGRVPGDPVITIKVLGPIAAREGTLPLVQWNVPSG